MRLMTLDMRLVTLVPNHLSTVKNYQSTTSISHPYSSLFTTFHPSNLKTTTLHQSGEGKRGVEVKKRVAARRKWVKRGAEQHGRRWYGEKKRCREGQRGAYRHQSLIIYRPSLSPPMPNHLSTPHSRHQSLIICLLINFTNFTTHFLVSMTVREGWKRGKKRG